VAVRELILGAGLTSAMALGQWQQALDLNHEIITSQRERGAGAHATARTRFNNHGPLLELGRLAEVDQLLRDCQDVYETAGDFPRLGRVYGARAALEDARGHRQEAVELLRLALRLSYVHPEPRDIAILHHNLANYLYCAPTGSPAEQHAHRIAGVGREPRKSEWNPNHRSAAAAGGHRGGAAGGRQDLEELAPGHIEGAQALLEHADLLGVFPPALLVAHASPLIRSALPSGRLNRRSSYIWALPRSTSLPASPLSPG